MSKNHNFDGWMTKQEAAVHLGLAEKTLDRMAESGKIQKNLSDGLANRFQTLVEAEGSKRLTRRIVPALVRSLYLARSLWKLPTPMAA
jgi:hypothetical protein